MSINFSPEDDIEPPASESSTDESFQLHQMEAHSKNSEKYVNVINKACRRDCFISDALEFKELCDETGVEDHGETQAWCTALKEANNIKNLHKDAGCFSFYGTQLKFTKVRKGKSKPKFSINAHSSKQDFSWTFISKFQNTKSSVLSPVSVTSECEKTTTKNSLAELLEDFENANEFSHTSQMTCKFQNSEHFVPGHSLDCLESLQETKGEKQRTFNMVPKQGSRKQKSFGKRNLACLGNRALDNEDSSDLVDDELDSSDEEINAIYGKRQVQECLPVAITNGRSMSDRIMEALDASARNDEESLCPVAGMKRNDYHGRLKRIIQNEKVLHVEFLKKMEAGESLEFGGKTLDVQIQSKYLDGKLLVCLCSLWAQTQSSNSKENSNGFLSSESMEKTIIFNSRVCGNIDFESGNFIRIYSPWKEIWINKEECMVILCTYFSPINAGMMY